MVDLCENQYYTGESCKKNRKWKYIFVPPEFFWFPNHGSEEGFWQNCWNNDGQEEHSKNLNISLDYEYQVGLVMFPKSIFSPGVFKLLVWVGHEDLEAVDPFTVFRRGHWQGKRGRMAALLVHQGGEHGSLERPACTWKTFHHPCFWGYTLSERPPLLYCPGQ